MVSNLTKILRADKGHGGWQSLFARLATATEEDGAPGADEQPNKRPLPTPKHQGAAPVQQATLRHQAAAPLQQVPVQQVPVQQVPIQQGHMQQVPVQQVTMHWTNQGWVMGWPATTIGQVSRPHIWPNLCSQ